jgi:hypothetical protein
LVKLNDGLVKWVATASAVALLTVAGLVLSAEGLKSLGSWLLQVSATVIGVLGAAAVAWAVYAADRAAAERRAVQERMDDARLIADTVRRQLILYVNYVDGVRRAGPPFGFLRRQLEELQRPLGVSFVQVGFLLNEMDVARQHPQHYAQDRAEQDKNWDTMIDRLYASFERLHRDLDGLEGGKLTNAWLHQLGAAFRDDVFAIMVDHRPDRYGED